MNGLIDNPSNSKPFQRSRNNRTYWRALVIAICMFLFGVAFAIGYYAFLHSLNNKLVHNQVWIGRYSLAMAFIVKTSLGGVVAFAFAQKLWQTLQQVPRGVSVSALNSVFSAVESPLVLLSWDAWRFAFIPVLMIVPLWLRPFTTLVAPTALSQGILEIGTIHANCQVPLLDMNLESNSNLENVVNGAPLSTFTQEGGYQYPSIISKRLVNSVAVTGQKLGWPSPCGTNCSYGVTFNASSWKCTPSADISPPDAPWVWPENAAIPNDTICQGGHPNPWFDGCGDGTNITAQSLVPAQIFIDFPGYEAKLSNVSSRLWVGVRSNFSNVVPNPNTTTIKEFLDLNVFYCDVMNTTYEIGVAYENSQQSVWIDKLHQFAPIKFPLANQTEKLSPDALTATWSLYTNLVGLLSGNITYSDPGGWNGQYTAVGLVPTLVEYNTLGGNDPYLPIYNLASLLGEISRNMTISLISNPTLAVTTNTTTNCYTIEANVFKYDPVPLIVAYVIRATAAAMTLVIGMFSIWSSVSARDKSFSTILYSTRGEHLDRLVAGEQTVALPRSEEVQNVRLRFSESNIGPDDVNGESKEDFILLGEVTHAFQLC
jgi:hypothetical protein